MGEQSGLRRRGKESETSGKENAESHNDWIEEKTTTEEQPEKPANETKAESPDEQLKVAEVNAANGLTLETAMRFMEKQEFLGAVPVLEKLLEGMPEDSKDPACLHNLAVCFERLGDFQKAEDTFWDAATVYEEQLKSDTATPEQKSSLDVYSTMFGLAVVMTQAHNGNSCKLLQAEVLLRDILEKSIGREDMTEIMYRTYVVLAENCSLQKKWWLAAQAYEHSIALGTAYGTIPPQVIEDHRRLLANADKLARFQRYMRIFLWAVMIAVLCITIWYVFFRDAPQAVEGHARQEATPSGPRGLMGAIFSWLPW